MFNSEITFRLTPAFLEQYKDRKPPFGFGALGEIVYLRTYSRLKDDGTNEVWWETVKRVVEGTYSMQKRWIIAQHLPWTERKAQMSAQEMYERIFTMKFLPPGRGLWAMGSPLTEERQLWASLNNCCFVSTDNLAEDLTDPFTFLMDTSMLGLGCGFDTKGAGTLSIKPAGNEHNTFVIPDTREGWVESLQLLLNDYFIGNTTTSFDYSMVRGAGEPIKGFGGISSGPKPLIEMHEAIKGVLQKLVGTTITKTAIVDIMNLIGKCVVSGNIRRSAEIALGDDSDEFLDLKNYKVNPHRAEYGWTSNNSVYAEIGQDYSHIAERIKVNGEPGVLWLENMQNFSRMCEPADSVDYRAAGANPCVSGDTPILTTKGWKPIETVVGQSLSVWNGFEWSEVTPKITGTNQELLSVEFSNGRTLKCTPYHEFVISTDYKGGTERVHAEDLKIGMKLIKNEWPILSEGISVNKNQAYTQGFISGDGQDNYDYIWLYEPKYVCQNRLVGVPSVSEFITNSGVKRKQFFLAAGNFPKTFVPHGWDTSSRINWLAGLMDSDGTVCTEGQVQIGSIDKNFLLEVQLMLTTLGVASKVAPEREEGFRELPDGKGGNKDYWCQKMYRLLLGAQQVQDLVTLGLTTERLDLSHIPQRDATRFVTVDKITPIGVVDKVYCFNEPKRHLGAFNGIVTGQCVEQTLESYEVCCLCETFPARHDSIEDYLRTLKFAYLYAKTVTLGRTPWARTNEVLLRNRRIGLSQSGITQAIERLGIEAYKHWCEEGYEQVQYYDKIYSDWFAIPRSIKTTSVKPSGTVSLLAGATPGMHFAESLFYIRRIRLSTISDLIGPLEAAGYHIEPCVGDDSSVVVEIPVQVEAKRTTKDVSMWEQLNLAAFMQKYWSDNQVSSTITFNPETEGNDILYALNHFQYQLKAISFLPQTEEGAFEQMPYETITEQVYLEKMAKTKELSFVQTHEKADAERFCDGAACSIL